jgi:hypothetical protein
MVEYGATIIYQSDSFAVVATVYPVVKQLGIVTVSLPITIYELVRKDDEAPTVTVLTGAEAEAFTKQIAAWTEKTPRQEEVEACLDRFTQLGQMALIQH